MKKIFTLILVLTSFCYMSGRSYYPKFTSVQGYRGATDNQYTAPWRAINNDASDSILYSIDTYGTGIKNCSFIRGDKVYLLSTNITTEFDYLNTLMIFDALTGKTISDTSTVETYDGTKSLKGITYDALEKAYYLLTYKYSDDYFDCSIDETYLQKYDTQTKEISYITTMGMLWQDPLAMAYNPLDGEIYLINYHGKLGKLDKTTGFVESIVLLPIPDFSYFEPQYSMVYSIELKAFVVSYSIYLDNDQYEVGVIHVDPLTKTCKKISATQNFNNGFYPWMANPDVYAVALSPKKPIVYINYPQASTIGSIDITVPSYAINDTPLEGEVYLEVGIDSTITKLTGSPGEKLSVPMELNEGNHRLGINTYQIANSDTTYGVGAHCLFFVGNDTPKAPTNVILDSTSIKWDNVDSIGINNGYVNTDEVKYNVYLNDKKLNEEPIADTQYNINIDVTDTQLIYQAHVEAIINTTTSTKAGSNMIYVGNSYTIPTYPNLLDFASELTNGTVISINREDDAYCWEWDNIGRGYGYNCNSATWAGTTDDWLVLPKISFDKPLSFYEINIYAFHTLFGTGGKYEICFSTTPNPKDIKFKKTTTTKFDYHSREEESFKIFIPEAKDYYIMFHPDASAIDNIYIQSIIFDYAKNLVELEGEFAFRSRTTKLNWKNNLYADTTITIKGYNVYRDGNLLTQVDNNTTSFNDKLSKDITEVDHKYNISIRYEYDGKEYETELSNTFVATYDYGSVEGVECHDASIYSIANEIIIEDAPIGSTLSITSIDGKLLLSDIIKSDKETFNARKGVYLITLNGKTTKVIVN